jgi:hypothetical protein
VNLSTDSSLVTEGRVCQTDSQDTGDQRLIEIKTYAQMYQSGRQDAENQRLVETIAEDQVCQIARQHTRWLFYTAQLLSAINRLVGVWSPNSCWHRRRSW